MTSTTDRIEKLDPLTFTLDQETLFAENRIREADRPAFQALLEAARQNACPKAIYTIGYVTIQEDQVQFGSANFQSAMLAHNLTGVERVFPYVVTCGRELDAVKIPADDYLAQFWWDSIKEAVLHSAHLGLSAHIQQKHLLSRISTMNPGSGDVDVWPIEQQIQLFDIFGGQTAQIGVELTPSFLMIPNKTVSGIIFPTEKDFRTCQVCQRLDCRSRSAAFEPQLWESIHAS